MTDTPNVTSHESIDNSTLNSSVIDSVIYKIKQEEIRREFDTADPVISESDTITASELNKVIDKIDEINTDQHCYCQTDPDITHLDCSNEPFNQTSVQFGADQKISGISDSNFNNMIDDINKLSNATVDLSQTIVACTCDDVCDCETQTCSCTSDNLYCDCELNQIYCSCDLQACSCDSNPACNCESNACSTNCQCENTCSCTSDNCSADCTCDGVCECNHVKIGLFFECICESQCICESNSCTCDGDTWGCTCQSESLCTCVSVACSCNVNCGECNCVAFHIPEINCLCDDVACACHDHCSECNCNDDCVCETYVDLCACEQVCSCEFVTS